MKDTESSQREVQKIVQVYGLDSFGKWDRYGRYNSFKPQGEWMNNGDAWAEKLAPYSKVRVIFNIAGPDGEDLTAEYLSANIPQFDNTRLQAGSEPSIEFDPDSAAQFLAELFSAPNSI